MVLEVQDHPGRTHFFCAPSAELEGLKNHSEGFQTGRYRSQPGGFKWYLTF